MNDNIAIYGAKGRANQLKQIIDTYLPSIKVKYFIENKLFCDLGKELNGAEIISLYRLKKLYKEGEIAGVIIPTSYHKNDVKEMHQFLLENDIEEKDIYATPINILRKGKLNEQDIKQIMVKYCDLVQIFDVLIHVNDHCNLKCKSCCLFCNLVPGEVFRDFNSFKRDINRLHELTENIYNVSLLGGEPLLNNNLTDYISETRKVFPYAQITLTTNGLLLHKVSKRLFDCIRENQATIKVSLYPPLRDKVEDFVKLLRNNGIDFFIEPVYKFSKRFSLNPIFDKDESVKRCKYPCTGLRNGKICKCEIALYIDYFNRYFNQKLPESGAIDIYDESLTGKRLMDLLEKPLDLCSYCSEGIYYDWVEWEQSNGKSEMDEFLIREDFYATKPIS